MSQDSGAKGTVGTLVGKRSNNVFFDKIPQFQLSLHPYEKTGRFNHLGYSLPGSM